jgi:ribosomal protein S18 acetylase RimI-like enzyme
MRQAAGKLVGEHDFASFARPGHGRENTIRTVLSCDVARRGSLMVVGVEGTGFLWNMVRIIVGTLVEVGLGRLAPHDLERILAARDRQAAGPTAPPHGLYLQWIRTSDAPGERVETTAPPSASTAAPLTSASVTIRIHHGQFARPIVEMARGLGEWFTPKGLREIEIDARHQRGLVAFVGDGSTGARTGAGTGATAASAAGFLLFNVNAAIAIITWMGVAREHHRRGIGRRLIDRFIADLRAAGIREVRVETLGPSVDYEPYARTRAFYAAIGFSELRRVPHPDNPECRELLIMRRDI